MSDQTQLLRLTHLTHAVHGENPRVRGVQPSRGLCKRMQVLNYTGYVRVRTSQHRE